MKKLLIFITLTLSFGIYAQAKNSKKIPMQTAELKIQTNAKKYFEEVFVQKTFKDPYSYELKKIWIVANNREHEYNELYNYYDKLIKETDTTSIFFTRQQDQDEFELRKKLRDDIEKDIKSFTPEELKEIITYTVHFDAYGANSYGNKVLGRYHLKMDKNSTLIGKVEKTE